MVRIWSGLGYNRRALNLHRAAVGSSWPNTGERSRPMSRPCAALPGVGPYTARAVRSFAFGADVATVDTNVVRVLARCVAGAPLSVSQAQALADRLIPAGRSWDFNQSMFDLGATVCTPPARPAPSAPCRGCAVGGAPGCVGPDPWRASPSARPQSRFAGSDRQGRGRLVQALRAGAVPAPEAGRRLRLAR